MAHIGAHNVLSLWLLADWENVAERFIGIKLSKDLGDSFLGDAFFQRRRNRCEDATRHWGEHWREAHVDRRLRQRVEVLNNLWRVTVRAAWGISFDTSHGLCAQQRNRCFLACARHTGHGDNGQVRFNEFARDCWKRAKGHSGGETSRDRYPFRSLKLLTVTRQLRNAIRPGACVFRAVEILPILGIFQAEISSTVDDHDVLAQRFRDRPRVSMWQT